jgi:hypothetical protein
MRLLPLLLALVLATPFVHGSDEEDAAAAIAAVQTVFDGMAAHDAAKIRSVLLPGAQLHSVRSQGEPTLLSLDEFAGRIAGMTGGILERFTSPPKVMVRGRMAEVWGEFEFLRDGKFNHCGVDSAIVFKTAGGWKIATISDTNETTGCPGH